MSYLGKVFESLTNKFKNFQRFQNFRRFRVFVLNCRAKTKGQNDGKFRKPHFRGKLMNGVLFSWVQTSHLDEKCPKSSIWANHSSVGNNERHLEQQFRKSSFFFGLCGIQILKVTYMSYLGIVFESLTNKIQSFQRFQNFRLFRVFILSYRANSKRRKRRKISNLVECKAILLLCFFKLLIMFFV